MLFNFCDPRLRPEIQCNTVSTEGYEVTNLISDNDKGFLAYACIKPPKSSGFQLYSKTSNDASVPYALLATGFLDHSNAGLLLYPSNVNHETISVPPNFLKRYIKPSLQYLTTYISNLRICICKTENSVPALGKIEVWGTVSPRCGKDTMASICTLWSKPQLSVSESVKAPQNNDSPITTTNNKEQLELSLQVPECFLDAITWEIMTQPILLPSGKIIDQTTLQKHEETEALWGRRLTDPFTGLPFSEDRKPVIANALKARIDKFLLENSNVEEIKRLPRVLGRTLSSDIADKKVLEIPKYLLKENVSNKSLSDNKSKLHCRMINAQESKKFCHKLPVIVMSSKRNSSILSKPTKKLKTIISNTSLYKETESKEKESDCISVIDLTTNDNVDDDVKTVAPYLKRFDSTSEAHGESSKSNSCSCCSTSIFYQLPCKHVLCRKVLLSMKNNHCTACGISYNNSEIQRIYE
ncbi:RING finger protein 37 isoform X2 [Megachile rotundata]|uniref:RING finger protein 37 isoform X2 n=1 Tax=Megachile rotundata TaxID=143995 RepID=UPI003FD46189